MAFFGGDWCDNDIESGIGISSSHREDLSGMTKIKGPKDYLKELKECDNKHFPIHYDIIDVDFEEIE